VSSKQEQTLIKIYKAMSTAEIESRLAGNGLIQLARGVAENELQKRRAGTAEPAPEAVPRSGYAGVVFLVISSLLTLGAAALLMPHMTPLIAAVAVPLLCQVLGKAFPKLAIGLGALMLAAAAGLVIYLFVAKVPVEERVLMFFFGTIFAVILAALGMALIHGARHQGSWEAFATDLEVNRKKAMESIRR
jgi:hypothetical protein